MNSSCDGIITPMKKLPIITSAPHDSDDFAEFSERVALDTWQIGEFSDKYTADTAYHPKALGNLKSTRSRGLGSLNQPRDYSLFKHQDFHGNTIWKDGLHLTSEEKEYCFTTHHDPFYEEIKKLIKNSRDEGFEKVILWDHHDTGDFDQRTGKRDRMLPGEKRTMPPFILSNFGIPHTGSVDPNYGFTSSPSWFVQKIQTFISEEFGIDKKYVEINTSYKGGYITQYFGNPINNFGNEVYAIQIEYNRGFIMDQSTRKPDLKTIKEFNKKFNRVMEKACESLQKSLY